jgi:hypothetical protein
MAREEKEADSQERIIAVCGSVRGFLDLAALSFEAVHMDCTEKSDGLFSQGGALSAEKHCGVDECHVS